MVMSSAPEDAWLITWKSEYGIGRIIVVERGALLKKMASLFSRVSERSLILSSEMISPESPDLLKVYSGREIIPSVTRSTA